MTLKYTCRYWGLGYEWPIKIFIYTSISCIATSQAAPSPTTRGVGTVPLLIPRSCPPPLWGASILTRGRRLTYRAPIPTTEEEFTALTFKSDHTCKLHLKFNTHNVYSEIWKPCVRYRSYSKNFWAIKLHIFRCLYHFSNAIGLVQ